MHRPPKMKTRARLALSTTLLVAIALGAFGIAWYTIVKLGKDQESQKAEGRRVVPFEPSQAIALKVKVHGEETKLERTGPQWRLVEPVVADADPAAAEALLKKLSTLERRAVSAPAGEPKDRLREYGIDEGSSRIEVDLAGGQAATLVLGAGSGFDGSMFVMPKSGEVVVVSAAVRPALEKTSLQLRDRRLMRLDPAGVSKVEVSGRKGSYTLLKIASGWTVMAPGLPSGERADRQKAEDVVAALSALEASSFETGKEPPGPPLFTVRLTFLSGSDEELKAYPPSPGDKNEMLVVRPPRATQLARIAASALSAIDLPGPSLRDLRLLPVDREDVASVKIEGPQGSFTISRTPGEKGMPDIFTLAGKGKGLIDPFKGEGLVLSLTGLAADRVVDETGKGQSEDGLVKPKATYALFGRSGAELGRILVGREVGGDVLVRTGASPRIVAVERSKLASLPLLEKDLAPPAAPPGGTAEGAAKPAGG